MFDFEVPHRTWPLCRSTYGVPNLGFGPLQYVSTPPSIYTPHTCKAVARDTCRSPEGYIRVYNPQSSIICTTCETTRLPSHLRGRRRRHVSLPGGVYARLAPSCGYT